MTASDGECYQVNYIIDQKDTYFTVTTTMAVIHENERKRLVKPTIVAILPVKHDTMRNIFISRGRERFQRNGKESRVDRMKRFLV
jgi:hypothetical protein